MNKQQNSIIDALHAEKRSDEMTAKQNILFELPPKKKRKFVRTQQWICKRCKHSIHDDIGAYCEKFDLCLDFEDGHVCISNGGIEITCDGKKWQRKTR